MLRRTLIAALALALPVVAAASPMKGSTRFTVRIENISTTETLALSNGTTAPAPNSPGMWLVHSGSAPVFTSGKLDRGQGLEAQSEDGNPAKLAESLHKTKGVVASGVFNTPVGDDKPGPALPGKSYEFTFEATPGMRLTLTSMFGQSNDWFFAPKESGIALFDKKGMPVAGDLTSQLLVWDAGTEVDEEPGLGANQAPRQAAPNTGPSEKRAVSLAKSYPIPAVSRILRVTITPEGMASK